jgi:TP901 family phage tail tape measure protein
LADQNIVTNITATANFSSLTAQLQAVTSQLLKLQATTIGLNKNLTSQVGVMNRQFDETMRSTGQFSRHFVTLTSDVSKFGQNLDSGRMKLGQYFRTWQGHTQKTSSLVRDLAKQQVMLENAIIQPLGKNAQGLMQYNVMVQSGLDVTKNKSALLRQELAIMNKVMMDGSNQLINWGKNTQWAGRQLTVGLTVPLAAFGMAAAKAFRQADEELVRLTKVYGGLTATSSADLLQVRKDVMAVSRELASGLGANFTETIALAADIAATGKQGADLIDSTRQTTRLAILGEVDRQEAMKATLAIQTAFGQNTMELAESIDFLNAVENQTSTTLDDLVTAIPKAGPVVKALGGDVQDLALYLTAMREGGINASEGANALKSALASVINPTKVAKEMFMGFGIDLSGIVNKNAGNLTGTIMALKDSLDSLEPLQRARAIEQLFGKFQFARINALFENLGKEGSQTLQVLDLMKASTQDLAAISARELTALTESASGKYRRALESVKAELAVVGEQFLKVGAFVLNAIDGILKFIGSLPAPIKAVLGFIGGLTAIAGPIIMLTGVLANFFGYIIKGVLSLKNIGKGGTGFKLLTPELMAASAAAETVEQSFYSDTKAAATFSDAVMTLAASFEKLKQSAMSATVATSNSMSTVGGNPVLQGGGRIVDKNNPLVGKAYSRDMSHFIPTGSKTPEQRANETIFSTAPGPKPVNQRISNSAQLYMTNDLPKIPGVTSVNGVSTGVVAAEAAKWHSMTAAIAMQSQAEIAQLKTEIAATGTITASLSDSYNALLPQMTKITSLAADETALIVKQLQAGKITVEAARTKIFALNAQVEAMMVQTAQGIATAQARNISLTTVPLTSQPVVSATGKSNMKELFHKTETSKLVDSIARGLGVRTSGAGYSMQTTIPRKYNKGGKVESFGPNKTQVSGPASINYDDRMGSVPIGGYVLNQKASLDPANRDLVAMAPMTYSQGGDTMNALLTPKETVFGPGIHRDPKLYAAVDAANNGYAFGGDVSRNKKNYGLNPASLATVNPLSQLLSRKPTLSAGSISGNPQSMFSLFGVSRRGKFSESGSFVGPRGGEIVSVSAKPATATYGAALARMPINPDTGKPHTLQSLNGAMARRGLKGEEIDAYIATLGYMSQGGPLIGTTTKLLNKIIDDPKVRNPILQEIDEKFYNKILQIKRSGLSLTDSNNPYHDISNEVLNKHFAAGSLERNYWDQYKIKTSGLNPLYLSDFKRGAGHSSSAGAQNITLTAPDGTLIKIGKVKGSGKDEMAFHSANKDWESEHGFNLGGMIPGGNVQRGRSRYGIPSLGSSVISKLTAKWPKKKDFSPQGKQYKLGNQDPLHGPLQIGMSQNLKRYSGYDPNANPAERILYRDEFQRMNIMPGFLVGDERRRGLHSTARYMSGDLDIMSQMETLKNHPLGPIAAMKALQTKFSGKLYRGILGNSTQNPLPKNILDQVLLAKQTGDWSGLLGKEFIMRRSSWSKDQEVASFFAMRNQRPDSILLEARVRNRNILDASSLFPGKAYQAPYGQSYNTGRFGTGAKNEQEAIFGGKFKIIGYNNGRLQLETVAEAREMGGPVDSGKPYLVGEKGPELFVPKNAGGIIPNYEVGGLISRGKYSYGLSGNPAKRAQQLAEQAARAAQYEPAPMENPEYKEGPMSVGKVTSGGTSAYVPQGSLPYAPGLKMPLQSFNNAINASISSIGNNFKTASTRMVANTRMLSAELKSSLAIITDGGTKFSAGIKKAGITISKALSKETVNAGAPGAGTMGGGAAFFNNAKYSTASMLHPIQYLKNKGIGANPEKPLGTGAGGMLAGTVGGMAIGGMIGNQVGGQNGAMMGSMVGSIAGQSIMPAIGSAVKAIGGRAVGTGLASAGLGATAAGIAGLVAPLAAVTAAAYAGYKAWKHYKEGQTLNISTFGMTAEAAKKANLRFTDFGSKIKDTIQDSKDMADANKLVYESMKDGGTPFQMTIAEYKKLKVEVKETFGEQIKALDRQPSNKVPDAVRRIKEQLIAAGMSAEEATKKVYTMLQLSNKKDQSITATIGNSQFKAITDAQTAAVSSVTSFGKDTRDQGNKEKAAAFNTALMATETAINDLMAKRAREVAKDTEGKKELLTYAEAEKMVLDQINKSEESRTKITKGTVDEIAKTNPQVRKIINGSDTIVSTWQKIRLEALGFNGDLSKLSAEQAATAANLFSAVSDAVQSTNRAGILKEQYSNLDKLKGQIESYTKALKGQTAAQQISDRDRIASLNKQIDANNKLADARKKALTQAQADADLGREIEKTRLAMQNAMAVGDTAQAQSLRIDLESKISQQQTEAQTRAIDKANEKDNKPLKAAIEAINNKQKKLGDAAALAGDSLDGLKIKYDKQKAAIDKVNTSMTSLYANANLYDMSIKDYIKKNKTAAAGLVADYEAATGKKMARYSTDADGKKIPISPQSNALTILANSKVGSSVDLALATSIKGGATLKDIVNAVKGMEDKQLRKNIKVTGDYSKSKEEKTVDGKKVKVLNAEARDSIRKRLDLQVGETFVLDGQKYGMNTTGGTPVWHGAAVEGKAEGGTVRGPGTGTSDSIPAYLSNGEYVIKADSVKKYGVGTFDALNAQKFADGGMVKDGWLQKWAKSLSGQPGAEMMGTAALLRKIAGIGQKGDSLSAGMLPLSFAGMGIGSKIGASGGLMKSLFAIPNKINQIRNQAKVNAMIKRGMWHGSQPTGHRGEDYLQGTNILDGPESHDPYYGMGFFGTSSKGEADLYAGGYNSVSNWGESYGSMNHIVGAPRGKYVDFTRGTNSLKWQDYSLAKALGVKRNGYIGNYMPENLGDIMTGEGMTGAIMNRVNSGYVPKDIAGAKWLAWNNPAGVMTKEKFAQGGLIKIPQFKKGINAVPKDMLAMLHKNEAVLPASMNPYNPDGPRYNLNRNSYKVSGDGAIGASYVVNQNIYASDGMDVEALSNMIVKKAEVVIGQKAKVNVKMVGQGKSI